MSDWYTLSALVEKTGIPYQSLARYVQRHSQHLKIKKEHKSYLVHNDSVLVLEHIRKCYQEGMTEKQVDTELSLKGIPITINFPDENEISTLENTLKSMQESMRLLHEKAENQEKFNQELVRQLEKQQHYINTRLEERDKALMLSLKETLEAKQQMAIAKSKKWWRFW